MPYRAPVIVLGFAASAVLAATAFAQETRAPPMPADLARMAQSAAQKMQAPPMPADLARMAESAQTRMAQSPQSRYLPEYTDSGDMKLLPNSIWREWVYVGSPLTPNALNGGHAGFPEYHNV
jgi:hypothetical protein